MAVIDARWPQPDIYDRRCPARNVLGHVTGRWGGLIITALLDGTLRYSELRTRVDGISEKMLALTLRELQLDGLIVRTSYPVVPPRTDYQLTDSGREVAGLVRALVGWIEEHLHDVLAARECPQGEAINGG
jgi:DNA-binding HxlR family transcriptional regulator